MFVYEYCFYGVDIKLSFTENAQNIPIYSISEVLSEKIRALIQRSYTAPKDYFVE